MKDRFLLYFLDIPLKYKNVSARQAFKKQSTLIKVCGHHKFYFKLLIIANAQFTPVYSVFLCLYLIKRPGVSFKINTHIPKYCNEILQL